MHLVSFPSPQSQRQNRNTKKVKGTARERETSVGNDVIHTHFSVFKGALPFFFFRAPLICPHCSLKDLSATVKSSKFTRDLITFSPLGQQVIYLPSNIMLNERIMTSSVIHNYTEYLNPSPDHFIYLVIAR